MSEPIFSIYADDEDMCELVEMFVDEMPKRIAALEAAVQGGDRDQLTVLSHQLKGSAGSYGFDVITDAAAVLEASLKASADDSDVQEKTAVVVDLMKRATAAPQA